MKLSLKIALVALLGSIAVEGYNSRSSHKRRGSSHDRPSRLENLGRNGPLGPYGPHGKREHTYYYRRHHYRVSHGDARSERYYSEESSEFDTGPDSEFDDSFDSYDYIDWYKPGRRPCSGWRCRPRNTIASETRPPVSRTTTSSSKSDLRTPEPVTNPTTILVLTKSPNAEIIMSRNSPMEEASVTVTTPTPEANPTTMSSPRTTTISQATIDCIQKCIPTPEFHPVCGTNGETYDNIGKLFCVKNCGSDVELYRNARCSPILPFADDYNEFININSDGDGDDAGRGNGGDEGSGEPNFTGGDNGDGNGVSDHDGNSLLQLAGESLSPSSGDPSPLKIVDQPSPSDGPSPLQVVEQLPSGSELLHLADVPSSPSSPLDGEPPQSLDNEQPLADDEISPPPIGDGNTDGSTVSFIPSPTMSAPRFGRTTHLTDLQRCMKLCPVTSNYNPVCGTDLVNYINVDRIVCARGCGLDIQILCEQPCHVCSLGRRRLTTPTLTTLITVPLPSTSLPITTPETILPLMKRNISKEQCIKACPVTTEYSPVCGTDNVNYNNPLHLLCVQTCGEDVKVAKFEACSSDTRFGTPATTSTTTTQSVALSPAVTQCIKSCVVTSEYNPVCGTNEETYTNPGRLECAKYCGVDVKMGYKGFCNGFFFSGFMAENKPANDKTGSLASQATASWELIRPTVSSQRLPLRTSALTSDQTTVSTMPRLSVFDNPTTDTSIASKSFTLAPDVIISIFGGSSTPKSTAGDNEKTGIDLRTGNDDEENRDNDKNVDPDRIVFPD